MRDDKHSRQYPNDPHRRQSAGAGNPQGGDPLAELARLIGQNDPFSDFARDQGHAPPPAFDPRRADPAPSEWTANQAPTTYGQPGPSYRDAPQTRQPESYQGRQPEPRHGYAPSTPAHEGYRSAPEEHHFSDPFDGPTPADTQFPPRDDQGYAPREFAPRNHAAREQAAPAAQRGGQNFDPQQFDPQQYADPRYGAPAYGEQQYSYEQQGSFPPAQGQQGYGSDPYYRGGMPHDEDIYEDQPRARRRGGLLTVMAVLALAVVGTAGAFGYRTLFSGSGSVLTPPTIKADAGPNKVVPTAQGADASGKMIYDRVGEKNQTERVVSREEQPVDLKNATPPPRVVLSSGMANPVAPVPTTPVPPAATQFPSPSSPAATPTASVPPANASTEPKKIRTVTIRPDQPAVEPTAQTPVTRQASAAEQPMPPANTTVRTTTIRPPAAAAPSDSSAPLSLTPNNSAQRAPMRTASAPAARPLTTTSSDSAFAVQVTSQRTEADAQSSFQALQAKYPNVLGNRQAMIRRADLGDKGTYYRAQVPFGTQGEASEFCASLKAAGGQCVVQRN
jgi:hypothetical protein